MNAPLKNQRHEHFAQLLAKGEKAARAYVAAGYSKAGAEQSANRLLKDADVCSRIAQLRAAIEAPSRERAIEKAAVDKAWVLYNLTQITKMGMAAEPVRDAEGNPTGEYRANLSAANRSLELIGKELGMFVERKEIRTGALDGLPADQLKALEDALTSLGSAAGTAASGEDRTTH
jgi:phage terminase small subunit